MTEDKPLSAQEVSERIEATIIKEAKEKPWSFAWKFVTAKTMLELGGDIKHIKDTLGVTYKWLIRLNLIRLQDSLDKFGNVIAQHYKSNV